MNATGAGSGIWRQKTGKHPAQNAHAAQALMAGPKTFIKLAMMPDEGRIL
jgi:hypothetical protein